MCGGARGARDYVFTGVYEFLFCLALACKLSALRFNVPANPLRKRVTRPAFLGLLDANAEEVSISGLLNRVCEVGDESRSLVSAEKLFINLSNNNDTPANSNMHAQSRRKQPLITP